VEVVDARDRVVVAADDDHMRLQEQLWVIDEFLIEGSGHARQAISFRAAWQQNNCPADPETLLRARVSPTEAIASSRPGLREARDCMRNLRGERVSTSSQARAGPFGDRSRRSR